MSEKNLIKWSTEGLDFQTCLKVQTDYLRVGTPVVTIKEGCVCAEAAHVQATFINIVVFS